MSTTNPTSRFSRRFTINNKLCILSATEDGVKVGAQEELGNDFKTYPGGVFIFTERLAAYSYASNSTSNALLPAISTGGKGRLTVSATRLSAYAASDGSGSSADSTERRLCKISADGKAGVDNTAGATDDALVSATNGEAGGDIAMYVQETSLESIMALGLSARGGAGATTGNLDVLAGSGGNAGHINFFGRPSLTKLVALITAFETKQGIPLHWTDEMKTRVKKIAPTHPIWGALSELLLAVVTSAGEWDIRTSLLTRMMAPLNDLNKSAGRDRTALMIWRACNKTKSNVIEEIDNSRQLFWGNVDVRGGEGGIATIKGAEERGNKGTNGQDGSKTVIFDDSTELVVPSFVVAHPLQCKMTLDKAKALFYLDDAASRKSALRFIDGLLLRLAVVPESSAAADGDTAWHDVLKQYSQDGDIYEMPADKIFTTLSAIKDEAKAMSMQLFSGLVDCYGHQSNWAPRLSVSILQDAADTALKHLKDIEKSNADYYEALRTKNQINDRVKDQRAALRKAGSDMSEATKTLEERLTTLARSINSKVLLGQINEQRTKLRDSLDKISDKIRTEFKIGPSTIIKGLEMCAFSPEAPMIALQAGSALYTGYTSIPDDSDTPVQREVILKKIPSKFSDMVQQAGTEGDDGALNVDQKGYNLLLVQRDTFKDDMESFSKSSWAETAQEAVSHMDKFLDLVGKRNADIVEYNFTQKTVVANNQAVAKLEADGDKVERLAHSGDITAAELQQAVDLHATLLDVSRTRVMRTIALLQRAIYFSALSGAADLMAGLRDKTEAALEMNYDILQDRADRLGEILLQRSEKAGGDGSTFPSKLVETGTGKQVQLTAEQLTQLLDKGRVDVVIDPIYRDTKARSEFRDCADIRIYRARCWLQGLKLKPSASTTEQFIKIDIAHGGQSTFVTPEDDEYVFSHDPIYVNWSYKLKADGTTTVVDSGDMVVLDANAKDGTKYAAPGLITTWTIGLEHLVSDDLDMSSITGCTLEFWGNNYAFIPAEKATRRGRRAGGGVARVEGEDLGFLS